MPNQTVFSPDNNSRTFVMSGNTGGAPTASASAIAAVMEPLALAGNTPLLAAANPLLNLVYQIRTLAHVTDKDRLKDHLASEIRRFEASARSHGVSQEHVIATRYCLCTVLDETAAQTPWGSHGEWARDSLLVRFHNETWGGEKFYQLLAKLAQVPAQHIDVLEVMYYCIALGFEGRYRIVANGASQLEKVKRRLEDIIRNVRGTPDRALSLQWQPSAAGAGKVWHSIPLWVSALTTLMLATFAYIAISFYLSAASDQNFAAISALRLPEPGPVVQAAPPKRLSKFLEAEIRAGLVAVRELPASSTVIVQGDGLFDSGAAMIRPEFANVITRIAKAIAEVPGHVVVAGYTDNRPIRSIRFPSNWELSLARAKVVAAQISAFQQDPTRVGADGRGESDPIADNATAAGRSRNRRVEITVFASPEQLSRVD